MAALLKEDLAVDADLVPGGGGIFEVAVGDHVVAKKSLDGFPSDEEILDRVRAALAN